MFIFQVIEELYKENYAWGCIGIYVFILMCAKNICSTLVLGFAVGWLRYVDDDLLLLWRQAAVGLGNWEHSQYSAELTDVFLK